jgi:hypothetical protein
VADDLTPGVQREHPEQETAGVQARIEHDQVDTATALELVRSARETSVAEARGFAAGQLAADLAGIREAVAAHTVHLAANNGDIAATLALVRAMATATETRIRIAKTAGTIITLIAVVIGALAAAGVFQ